MDAAGVEHNAIQIQVSRISQKVEKQQRLPTYQIPINLASSERRQPASI